MYQYIDILAARKSALEQAVLTALEDEWPFLICPGCIVDKAIIFEEYLVHGTNSKHKHEEEPSNLTLLEE